MSQGVKKDQIVSKSGYFFTESRNYLNNYTS